MTPIPPESGDSPRISVAKPPPLPPPATRRPKPWTRWLAAFLILTFYPLRVGMISYLSHTDEAGPMLSTNLQTLMASMMVELAFFGLLFLGAWACCRPTAHQLFFRKDKLWRTMLFSFGFSIGLRMAVAVMVLGVIAVVALAQGAWPEDLSGFRADIDAVVDSKELAENPWYLVMNMTFVSFIVAGFREELWRAGMLAALMVMFPRSRNSVTGRLVIIVIVAVVFGLGHLPQGLGGVCLTGLLGAGLGIVMVWRWSIWEAALAHGFFNAASFSMLYVIARYPEALKALSEKAGQ